MSGCDVWLRHNKHWMSEVPLLVSFEIIYTYNSPPGFLTFDYSSCQCHFGSCWHSPEGANISQILTYPCGYIWFAGLSLWSSAPVNPIHVILISITSALRLWFLELDQDLSTSVSLLSWPLSTKSVSCHCSLVMVRMDSQWICIDCLDGMEDLVFENDYGCC